MNGESENNTSHLKQGSISKKSKQKFELPQQETNDLEEYIEILKNFEITCQGTGRYIEAEMAKNRVKDLKKEVDKKKREELKGQQEEEKTHLEASHTEEFNNFNVFWDKKMEEFISEAKKIEESLLIKQNEFYKNFEQEIEKSLPQKPKESAELLNLRKVEEQLAQQKEYIEAHKVQQKRILMEKAEIDKWILERKVKISKQLDQLKIKQKQEHQALLQKIESGQDEQRKTRASELEKILQKYQNVKKEIANQHQTDLSRLEKTLKNPSTMSISKFYGSRYMGNNSRFSTAKEANNNNNGKEEENQ